MQESQSRSQVHNLSKFPCPLYIFFSTDFDTSIKDVFTRRQSIFLYSSLQLFQKNCNWSRCQISANQICEFNSSQSL